MADTEKTILALEAHRDNLDAAKTFEEYKEAHVEYVSFLIDYYRHKKAMDDVLTKFVVKTETLIKTAVETPSNG